MEVVNSLVNNDLWSDFWVRLLANSLSLFVLIRFIYYPNNHRVKFIFIFTLMGMMIFLIASILDQVRLELGFALGLFAVFAIIRFRSPQIDLKELTYLFIILGTSIINALVEFRVETWFGLIVSNFIIICTTLVMEMYKPKNFVVKKQLVFQPSDYAVLNNNELLRKEIISKTGIEVQKVEIDKINQTKGEVCVWIYFRECGNAEIKQTSED